MTVARKSRTIATRPARTSSTSAYVGVAVVKTDMSLPSDSYSAFGWPSGMEWPVDPQDRPAQPGVRGHHQVAQRLRERPLAGHRHVDGARRHRATRSSVAAQLRSSFDPRRAQAIGIFGTPVGTAGKATVELAVDEGDHVDSVDEQGALAVEEPGRIDVRALRVDGTHHDAGEVSPDEPGAMQVGVDELRSAAGRRTG